MNKAQHQKRYPCEKYSKTKHKPIYFIGLYDNWLNDERETRKLKSWSQYIKLYLFTEEKIPQIGRSIVTDNTNRDFRSAVNAGHKSLQSVVTARVWPLHLGYGRLQDLVTAACHQTTEAWGSLSSAQVRHNFPAPRIGGPHGELDMKLFKPVGRFLFFDR